MNNIDFIRDKLGQDELLCQLAEEAAELAQAALKLRWAYNKENPTPMTAKEAYENLLEELADVSLVLNILGLDAGFPRMRISNIMDEKLNRWADRLKERAVE